MVPRTQSKGETVMATATSKKEISKVVPQAEWVAARKELLKKEKEFTRLRDELSRQRREMPWEKVEKQYVFDGPNGRETLGGSVRRTQPADRVSLHDGPGVERGLQELFVPGGSLRRRDGAPGASRHHAHGDFARDAAGDRSVQEANGMEVQVGVIQRE